MRFLLLLSLMLLLLFLSARKQMQMCWSQVICVELTLTISHGSRSNRPID
jgi:hypothetical protein